MTNTVKLINSSVLWPLLDNYILFLKILILGLWTYTLNNLWLLHAIMQVSSLSFDPWKNLHCKEWMWSGLCGPLQPHDRSIWIPLLKVPLWLEKSDLHLPQSAEKNFWNVAMLSNPEESICVNAQLFSSNLILRGGMRVVNHNGENERGHV